MLVSLMAIASLFAFSGSSSETSLSIVEENGDAPDTMWGYEDLGDKWQKISPDNITIIGSFQLNDSVDVYALEISSKNWTMVGFWLSDNDSVSISVQRLNQSTWSIVEFANGKDGELGLSPGLHAIRIERIGNYEDELSYRFTLENRGSFDENGEFVNLAWMFAPFYIFAGIFLILPLVIVLWWNRGNLLQFTEKEKAITDNEKHVLDILRERFSKEKGRVGVEEVDAALSLLGNSSWDSVSDELGSPETRYYTGNIDICSWRLRESGNCFLIGIRIGNSGWSMAAIRIFSPLGEVTTISEVVPEMMFQDDEVFLGDLEPGSTTFVQIQTEGSPPNVNMHISGLVDGEPIAAVPTKPIGFGEE